MKKIFCLITLTCMLFSSVACSNGSTSTTTGSTEVESKSDSTEAPKQTGEKVKLTAPNLGYNDDQIAAAEAREEGLNDLDRYHMAVRESIGKNYPDYEVEYVDWGWAETLDQKQRSMFASGDIPDLIAGEVFIPTYAFEGILEPLPDDIVDLVNPAFLIYDKDNKAVALAHRTSIFMLFYNKTLLEKAGLDPESPPKTWAEFQEYSEAVTAAGNGEYWGGGIPSFPHAGGAFRSSPFFRQMGTDYGNGTDSNLDDPKFHETLEFIRTMNQNLPAGLGNGADEGPLWNAFDKDQTVAFIINGSWEASSAEQNGVDWGVAPLPLPPNGVVGNCTVASVFLAVPAEAPNKEASFNLIRESIREENLKHLINGTFPVPLNSMIEDTSLYEDNSTLVVAMEAIANGTYTSLSFFPKNDSQIWDILNTKVLARTTMTNDPIADICSEAKTEIDALLG